MDAAPAALLHIGATYEIENVLSADRAVVYKHSPICGLSARAVGEVQQFASANPGIPVYLVDVIGQRGLSDRLARQLGVGHESPQVILLRDGRPCWSGSHFEVTAEQIAVHLEAC